MGAEQNAMNMGHSELGAWLLEKWLLPKEVIVVAREHHNNNYQGEHSNYASLIMLANNALGLHVMSDDRTEILSEKLCAKAGIRPSVVHHVLKETIDQSDHIDLIIKQLAA